LLTRDEFRRHHTSVNPRGDVIEIMTDGPFQYTRNPMYLSLLPLYVGGSLLFQLPWAWLLLLFVFLTLHFGVIIPEEKYRDQIRRHVLTLQTARAPLALVNEPNTAASPLTSPSCRSCCGGRTMGLIWTRPEVFA
jgi:hypothetical protein